MKYVEWDDETVPDILIGEDGVTQFFDRPSWYGLDKGDAIIYQTEIGTTIYRVTNVVPYYHPERDYYADPDWEATVVTIEGE